MRRHLMSYPTNRKVYEDDKWTGYYAIRVEIDHNEYLLDGQITRGKNSSPRLFVSLEEAEERAKKWNTGTVIKYYGNKV